MPRRTAFWNSRRATSRFSLSIATRLRSFLKYCGILVDRPGVKLTKGPLLHGILFFFFSPSMMNKEKSRVSSRYHKECDGRRNCSDVIPNRSPPASSLLSTRCKGRQGSFTRASKLNTGKIVHWKNCDGLDRASDKKESWFFYIFYPSS